MAELYLHSVNAFVITINDCWSLKTTELKVVVKNKM